MNADENPKARIPFESRNIPATQALSRAGVSIWLDYLSRDILADGELKTLIETRNVVGVTTNPTIFASAVTGTSAYDVQLQSLAQQGAPDEEAVRSLIISDIVEAAKLLEPIYRRTNGYDGRVSVEVEPSLASSAHRSFEQARELWSAIDRPNLMIKIPATPEGIEAIAEATASGISVNVTLLFSIDVYRLVIRAYLSGLERAQLAGHDITDIHSVASFFVSRVDAEVDRRLGTRDTPDAAELRGTVGVANARLAYRVFQEEFASPRAQRLLARGAHVQRLLWASTGVKNPDVADTYYIDELVAPETVVTIPPATLTAFAEHGTVNADVITDHYAEAVDTFDRLRAVGISYEKMTDKLLADGVAKFEASWRELADAVSATLRQATPGTH